MKQIINGKVYNTQSATRIDTHCNGMAVKDFYYLWEALYVTKKGAFFLHRDGGAASSCNRPSGTGSCGDERLERVTKDEALAWCENAKTNPDTIAEFFTVEEA
jgi:hypothetical protein